jgi:putative DNA methylase
MPYRKKLIEVALPLEAINKASAREKSIRHGHPSTLHLWWSRKPLATCRAVLFASLVDDPSSRPEEFPTEKEQDQERLRLFRLIEELVTWENSNNQEVLASARTEIHKSTGGNLPPLIDPFCGGGSIPLEAQRLGMNAHGGDLNPVAVLITKALIELPPKFANRPPVNPEAKKTLMGRDWHGAQGLADDIRYYGKWMRDEALQRIGHLYPKATLPKEYGNGEATVIAWLWVRTVKCPNPACGTRMPLTSKWWLSKKKNKEAWAEPQIDYSVAPPAIHFAVKTGKGNPQGGTINRQGAICIACSTPVPLEYIRNEGKAGRMGEQLMAIVAEGKHGRVYLPPTFEQKVIASQAKPEWQPEQEISKNTRWFSPPLFGMFKYGDIFTSRQLVHGG